MEDSESLGRVLIAAKSFVQGEIIWDEFPSLTFAGMIIYLHCTGMIIYLHIFLCIYIHIYIYIYIYICIYTYIFILIYVCTYHIYIDISMYKYL